MVIGNCQLLCFIFPIIFIKNFTSSLRTSTNITNGEINKNDILHSLPSYFQNKSDVRECECNVKNCIRKCCPSGQIFRNNKCFGTEMDERFRINVYDKTVPKGIGDFHYLYNISCHGDMYRLYPEEYPDHQFFIQENGELYFNDNRAVDNEMFCIESIFQKDANTSKSTEFAVFVCNVRWRLLHIAICALMVSTAFLLSTFLVYTFLPNQNLHAKALMYYVLSLALSFILYVLKFSTDLGRITCIVSTFLCYYFTIAAYCWINAGSFSIFFTFSGMHDPMVYKMRQNRRFKLASIYAWGAPLLLVCLGIVFTFSRTSTKNSIFYTGIGDGQCWFRSGWTSAIYLICPVVVLLLTNIILFCVTVHKLKQVRRDTKMLRKVRTTNRKIIYNKSDMEKFKVYARLICAMGLHEVVVWCIDNILWMAMESKHYKGDVAWIFACVFNAIYGICIFLIFVCRRRVWISIKERFSFRGKSSFSPTTITMENSRHNVHSSLNIR